MKPIVLTVVCLLAPALAAAQQESRVRITSAITVTEQPDGGAGVIGTVNAGQVLEVLDERNGWLLVRTFGGESLTSSGLATEFLIGYAPTDRLLIYYENSLQLTGTWPTTFWASPAVASPTCSTHG